MDTTTLRPVSESRARWLHQELADWEAGGLIDHQQTENISALYNITPTTRRRLSLGRLLLGLGAVFVGVGAIWLVAANLDQLSPVLRFIVVAGFWLLFLLGGEALAARQVSAPVVGAVRLMAALTYGASIFQAAQSLQVAVDSPHLLGLWGLGALLHGYAARAVLPLLVGIVAGIQWYALTLAQANINPVTALVAAGLLGSLAVSLSVLHDSSLPRFGAIWRTLGVAILLGTLFAAAVPAVQRGTVYLSPWLIAMAAITVIALVLAVTRVRGTARWEPAATLVVLGLATLLVLWEAGDSAEQVGAMDWLHAILSVGCYILVTVGVATLGTVRDNQVLTWLATIALVVFTTFQSFAVFAPIIQGAWLFLVLGGIFLGTGYLFDRARRELATSLKEGEGR